MIGFSVWQARFAGQPNVVGRTLRLGNTPHTVIGVMPQGFAFPINNRVWTLQDGGATGGRGLYLLVAVAALMAAVGLVAAIGPARGALRIQPTEALKAE